MEQKFTEKFKEQIGYFEGVEDVLNLSALNDEDYEQLSDDERNKIKVAVKDILEGLKPILEALDV